MRENAYQARLIKELYRLFPGCIVLKNDSAYIQGIPDLTILHQDRWAVLEVKVSANEPYRPNQEWYLDMLGSMSFAATIYPENEEETLRALQRSFRTQRQARNAQRKQG